MDLLRLSTAGSVDDGKSTLIGRLLYDTKTVFEDQLAAITRTSERKQEDGPNLALLTDGLRAEREQGITIDVAYRYFSTPKRKFIIADTPGHEQYTRNMVTGASTADLAIILVDARKGLLPQSRRHAIIAHLLRIPHVVVCINKMDLVGYDLAIFAQIETDFRAFASKLSIPDLRFIPVSALCGDNIVDKGSAMSWYTGPALLELLETIEISQAPIGADFRLPVQTVIRPNLNYRGYAGQIASGRVRQGDEIVVLPSGKRSQVTSIDTFDGAIPEAVAPQSIVLTLADEIDISRGDTLCNPGHLPKVASELDANICWMSETPLELRKKYYLKHGTKTTRVMITQISGRIDINSLDSIEATTLGLNEIGRVTLKAMQPLACDTYAENRNTGSLILIDELTHETVAAGMII